MRQKLETLDETMENLEQQPITANLEVLQTPKTVDMNEEQQQVETNIDDRDPDDHETQM